ncbi:MAG: MarR family transcriptional regulator [bacterium]|nr:MarR family transcriptional regulator [bacterium]
MKAPDPFCQYYAEDLEGTYDCVDRIVLNAYFARGQQGGAFRHWWGQLRGDDSDLNNDSIRRMAGDFSRRLRAWARAEEIPFVECRRGVRKHELAVEHLPGDPEFEGVFMVIAAMAPGLKWDVHICSNGYPHLSRRQPWPYVKYYHFHIIDREWGHLTIKMCGYPPFGCQVMANGHQWVERRLRKQTISLKDCREGNCFVGGAPFGEIGRASEAMLGTGLRVSLRRAVERWIYSSCLIFALDGEEQKRTGFRYEYSCYQLEYCRNLVFKEAAMLDEVFQGLIERTRKGLGVEKILTIFGRRRRGWRKGGAGGGKRLPVKVARVVDGSGGEMEHDMTVFKVHYGRLTVKMYDKGEKVLRVEAMAHNVGDLRCGRILAKLPFMLAELQRMVAGFLEVLQAAERACLGPDHAEELRRPSAVGKGRVAGVDMARPRMRAMAEALCELAPRHDGFRIAELAERVAPRLGEPYNKRKAAYDLRKLRAKGLVVKLERTVRYRVKPEGVSLFIGQQVLGQKVIRPILAALSKGELPEEKPPNIHPIDTAYRKLHADMIETFRLLGLAG